jgi:hypothetical protein
VHRSEIEEKIKAGLSAIQQIEARLPLLLPFNKRQAKKSHLAVAFLLAVND